MYSITEGVKYHHFGKKGLRILGRVVGMEGACIVVIFRGSELLRVSGYWEKDRRMREMMSHIARRCELFWLIPLSFEVSCHSL